MGRARGRVIVSLRSREIENELHRMFSPKKWKPKRGGCVLPEELVLDILLRLSVKTLLRCKRACRSWRNLITSSEFVKLHLQRSVERNTGVVLLSRDDKSLTSFDFIHPETPPLLLQLNLDTYFKVARVPRASDNPLMIAGRIVGVCNGIGSPLRIAGVSNGIVCFDLMMDSFCLYNPATRLGRKVEEPPRPIISKKYSSSNCRHDVMFGYDCIGDDYKILWVPRHVGGSIDDYNVNLYSLKAKSWKTISNPPPFGFSLGYPYVVAHNSFYWVTKHPVPDGPNVIVSFNLSTHTFEEVPSRFQCSTSSTTPKDKVVPGRLHTMLSVRRDAAWMLNEDNKWIQFLHAGFSHMTCLWSLPKDGIQDFICCDIVNSETITPLQVPGWPEDAKFSAMPWTESFVSLE